MSARPNIDPETDRRLRRLERLAALSFVETHGLGVGMNAVGSVRPMRAQCAQDVAAILAEHEAVEPPMETRA